MERTYQYFIYVFLVLTLSSCGGGDDPPNPTIDTISPNPTTSSSSSKLVECASNSEKRCIEITLRCTDGNAGWFNQECGPGSETIEIPHGRPVYALLVSGFAQNKELDMFHFYNFARCLQAKGAYVHYAWWNNLLAPYMERPLHNEDSVPSFKPFPDHDFNLFRIGDYSSNSFPFPNKALPADDHQFQADAEIMLKAIRKHNPDAAIVLVGHSMGGGAIVRLAANPNLTDDDGEKIKIALLAPIDPVGNRTCIENYPGAGINAWTSTCNGAFNFTRWRAIRQDAMGRSFWDQLLYYPPKRVLGSNIEYLYHRWQQEFMPPFDYSCPAGATDPDGHAPDVYWACTSLYPQEDEYLFDHPAERKKSIHDGSTNVQSLVDTNLDSGQDVPVFLGNFAGGFDGHGEIVGFRGALFGGAFDTYLEWLTYISQNPDWFTEFESYPLALKAEGDWPGGLSQVNKEDRVLHLKAWENDPNYLYKSGYEPWNPGLCMVSQDMCNILDQIAPDAIENGPPVADAGPDQTVECSAPIGTEVRLDGSGSSDPNPDDTLTYNWVWPLGTVTEMKPYASFPLGTHTITLTVTDNGGLTDTDTVDITVEDTMAPTLSITLSPNVLWPPNHKLVTITASIDVSDTCDDSPTIKLVSITSNEPDDGKGDGHTSDDIQGAEFGTDDREFLLRAERSGHGTDRIYTVTYSVTDSSGNVTEATAKVTVPHDHGKSK